MSHRLSLPPVSDCPRRGRRHQSGECIAYSIKKEGDILGTQIKIDMKSLGRAHQSRLRFRATDTAGPGVSQSDDKRKLQDRVELLLTHNDLAKRQAVDVFEVDFLERGKILVEKLDAEA